MKPERWLIVKSGPEIHIATEAKTAVAVVQVGPAADPQHVEDIVRLGVMAHNLTLPRLPARPEVNPAA